MSIVLYSMFTDTANRSSAVLCFQIKRELSKRGLVFDYITSSDLKQGCVGCKKCHDGSLCVIEDSFSAISKVDAIIIVSPVYFFGLPSQTKAFIDRLYSRDLRGVPIVLVLTSGSQFHYGGVDLIIETFKRIDEYCGSITITPYNKVTFDKVLPITEQDILGVSKVIDSLEELLNG